MGKNDRPYVFGHKFAHACDERGDRTCKNDDGYRGRIRRRATSKARRADARRITRQEVS